MWETIAIIMVLAYLFIMLLVMIGIVWFLNDLNKWTESKREAKIECARRMKHGIPKEP